MTNQRKICLPVIKSLRIEGYPLYPGKNNSGTLSKDLMSGVTVIAGINGQGKTTLLNILYRLLVGPWDQSKADFQNPGKKQHLLTQLKRFNYFSARIGRAADSAKATIGLQIGEEEVSITRSLGPSLEIISLTHGKTRLANPDEDRWLDLILELTGLPTHYDFHFVVRNFLFFLEDKVPLLWNPYGQFEILRILFLTESLATECANLHDQILKLDSKYRNDHWQLGLFSDRLATLRDQYGDDQEIADLVDKLASTQARYTALINQKEELEKGISSLLQDAQQNERDIFKHELELHDVFAELQAAESQYFARAFPDAVETAKLLYSELLLNHPCIICGEVHHLAKNRIQALLQQRVCPACESPFKNDEVIVDSARFQQERLSSVEENVNEKKRLVAELKEKHRILMNEIDAQQNQLKDISIELFPLEVAIKRAQNAKDAIPDEIRKLQNDFEKLSESNKLDWATLKKYRLEYENNLQKAADEIERIAQKICDKFKEYADQFLHQSAVLSYEMHQRTVGESGQKLLFPNFVVKIRSEAASELVTRPESDQVSESQREFIDLAFRMALLDTAVSQYGPAMLVVETPEASLDTVFIERAGKMLRQFANNLPDNRLIATCNLNGEDMISWLLGTAEIQLNTNESADIGLRVINLLEEGLPTAGYRAEPAKYDKAFQRALYGN